ncbi:MAG: PAS domain S-box protein, partial [Chitinophagaceae bacterium]
MEGNIPEDLRHFQTLVNASSAIVFRMSADWNTLQSLEGCMLAGGIEQENMNWMEAYILPEEHAMISAAIHKSIDTTETLDIEHRVRSNDSIKWFHTKAIPMVNHLGKVTGWLGAASDITSRKEVEEELQRQKRLYEAVTAGTPDLVYVFELDYTFSYANPALLEMWGKTEEEAIGKNLLQNGYEPWHAEMHEREIDHIVSTGQRVRGEVAFPHAVLGKRIYDYILT